MSRPYTIKDAINTGSAVSITLDKQGSDFHLAVIPIRPSTFVILNVPTAGAGWTAIATGLTNVLAWRLSEKDGNEFDYCYDNGTAGTSIRSYGVLQRDTALSAIYVKRTGAVDINMEIELEYA